MSRTVREILQALQFQGGKITPVEIGVTKYQLEIRQTENIPDRYVKQMIDDGLIRCNRFGEIMITLKGKEVAEGRIK